MPGCFSRSAAVPAARKVRMVVTFGTLSSDLRTTVKPLLSFFSVIFGRFKGLAAPGGGGAFCWAKALESERANAQMDSRVFMFLPFFVSCETNAHVHVSSAGVSLPHSTSPVGTKYF